MNINIDLLQIAEFIGLIAFAVSGSLVAIKRDLDLFGVLFCGVFTALGGGIICDLLVGNVPPRAFKNYIFLIVALVSSCIVFVSCNSIRSKKAKQFHFDTLLLVSDAIGLAAFAVSGVRLGIESNFGSNGFLCVFLGMTAAVGGGILRDIMTAKVPVVLRHQIYATAAIVGALIFYLLSLTPIPESISAYFSIAVTVTLRLMAVRFGWSMPHVHKSDQE